MEVHMQQNRISLLDARASFRIGDLCLLYPNVNPSHMVIIRVETLASDDEQFGGSFVIEAKIPPEVVESRQNIGCVILTFASLLETERHLQASLLSVTARDEQRSNQAVEPIKEALGHIAAAKEMLDVPHEYL